MDSSMIAAYYRVKAEKLASKFDHLSAAFVQNNRKMLDPI